MRDVAAALGTLCLSACIVVGDAGDGRSGDGDDGDGPDDLPGDPYDPAPEPSLLGEGEVAALAAQLSAVLDQSSVSGTAQSAVVLDLETGQLLYARNPELALIPASNTKLFTTGVALDVLGEDHRSVTAAYLSPDGDLYLVGDHDFTWSGYLAQSPRRPLDQLAAEIAAAGVTSVGDVVAAGEFLYDGERFGSYDAAANRAAAAVNFEAALGAAGISVAGGAVTQPSFEPPAGSELLATYESLPISAGAVPLNSLSHNEFADVLLRHVGHQLAGESSYRAGGDEVVLWLASLGITGEGVGFSDGSGLSRNNRVSARVVADTLEAMTRSPAGPSYLRTMSIGGIRGTLGNRMTGADTVGRVFGKTGTLSGVIATSGYLLHRADARRYAFSFLMNQVPNASEARAVQDQAVAALAADIRPDPSPPPAPTFLAAQNDRSNLVDFRWTEVEGATGYVLWLSRDGRTWDREGARLVAGPTHRADELGEGLWFARVTALGPGGESEPSDVVAAVASRSRSPVLLVDGNDRYQADPAIENPAALGHDFAVAYAEVLGEVGFDTVANEEVASGAVDLSAYRAVVWMLGEESTEHEVLDRAEQTALMGYLAGGGHLLISGAELGWDLVEQGDAMDAAFFREVLKADYVADSASSYTVAGVAGDFAAMAPTDFYNPGLLDVVFADVLAPAGDASPILTYAGGEVAGVLYDGEYRAITLGFPIEAVPGAEARRAILEPALRVFELLE